MDILETDDGTPVVELTYYELAKHSEGDKLIGEFCPNGCRDELEHEESETTCKECGLKYIVKGKGG